MQEFKTVPVRMPKLMHKELKLRCAEAELSMQAVLTNIIKVFLKNIGKK